MTNIEEMSLETRSNYDRLMRYLMNYAFDHHIDIEFTYKLPPYAPSVSYNEPGRLIIMNSRWPFPTHTPFLLAHEIGHVVEEVPEYYKLAYLGMEKGEFSANRFAINLLSLYCMENDIWYETYYDFAQAFGIPKDKYYVLEFVFESMKEF